VILGTALYFVSPIDIIETFGRNDAFLVTLLVSEVSQLLIEGVKARKSWYQVPNAGDNSLLRQTLLMLMPYLSSNTPT